MSKQQTAVEWLEEQIEWYNQELLFDLRFEIEQAKEMEKEQIISTYKEGHYHLEFDSFNPEQYYNETYGGNK